MTARGPRIPSRGQHAAGEAGWVDPPSWNRRRKGEGCAPTAVYSLNDGNCQNAHQIIVNLMNYHEFRFQQNDNKDKLLIEAELSTIEERARQTNRQK